MFNVWTLSLTSAIIRFITDGTVPQAGKYIAKAIIQMYNEKTFHTSYLNFESGVLVETKISKTRRVEFDCSVIATCNSTKKLRKPLLSRFAVINIPEYDKDQFINVAKDRLGNNPLAQYIVEEVWNS